MRSRMLLGLIAIGTIVVGILLVGPAGATQQASKARIKKLATVTVPLPAPSQAEIVAVQLNVSVPKGKSLGSLSVKVANAAEVKGADADAVAALPPASHKRRAKLTIYVAMYRGNLGAAKKGQSGLSMPILAPVLWHLDSRIHLNQAECPSLATSSGGNLLQDISKEAFKALVQSTNENAEKQWDVDTYADCGDQAEQPDPGDG